MNFLLDATLGLINLEQNQIIKIFTVAAVAFLPPTLVASVYGMNFDFMPELKWDAGLSAGDRHHGRLGDLAVRLFQAPRLALIVADDARSDKRQGPQNAGLGCFAGWIALASADDAQVGQLVGDFLERRRTRLPPVAFQ